MKTRFNLQGRCLVCSGGWLCIHCQSDNAEQDKSESELFRRVSAGIRAQRIAHVCASLKLEGDEFATREKKAERLLTAAY
jgi:hypothetical protein